MHDLLTKTFTEAQNWYDTIECIIDIRLQKFKNYIWCDYIHIGAKELTDNFDKYKRIYEKLFNQKIQKTHKIFKINLNHFDDKDYDDVLNDTIKKIQQEIERFETIVKEVLEK